MSDFYSLASYIQENQTDWEQQLHLSVEQGKQHIIQRAKELGCLDTVAHKIADILSRTTVTNLDADIEFWAKRLNEAVGGGGGAGGAAASGAGTTMSDISYLPTQVGVVQSALRGLKKVKKKWNLEILEGEKEYTVNVEDKLRITVLAEHWASFQAMLEGALDEKSCLDLSIVLQDSKIQYENLPYIDLEDIVLLDKVPVEESILQERKEELQQCLAKKFDTTPIFVATSQLKKWESLFGIQEDLTEAKLGASKRELQLATATESVDEDVATATEDIQQKLKTKYADKGEKLSLSTWQRSESQWYKFWILTDGTIIPVEHSHLETLMDIYVNYDDMLMTGALRGDIDSETKGLSLEGVKSVKNITAHQKTKLIDLIYKHGVTSVYMDIGSELYGPKHYGSSPVKSPEQLDYLFTYGPEETSESKILISLTDKDKAINALSERLLGEHSEDLGKIEILINNLSEKRLDEVLDEKTLLGYRVKSVYKNVEMIFESRFNFPNPRWPKLIFSIAVKNNEIANRLLEAKPLVCRIGNVFYPRVGQLAVENGVLESLKGILEKQPDWEVHREEAKAAVKAQHDFERVGRIYNRALGVYDKALARARAKAKGNEESDPSVKKARQEVHRGWTLYWQAEDYRCLMGETYNQAVNRAGGRGDATKIPGYYGKDLAIENGVLESLKEILDSSEVVYGWVRPSGEIIDIGFGDHGEDAVQRMKRISGEDYPRTSGGHDQACLDLMKLKKYIRMFEIQETDELNVSVGGKVSSAQLSVIGRLARDYNAFYYDIINQETGKKDSGKGHREFIEALRTCDLLESVVAK